MKKIFVGLILLAIVLISSCNFEEPTNEEVFNELQKTINDIDSYSCEADIIITGNKNPAKYTSKHIFMKPDKYRVEYHDKKQIISFDGNKTYLTYPNVDKSVIIKNSEDMEKERNLFVGYFLELLMSSEEVKLENDKNGEKEYLIISVDLPGNNIYRTSQRIWIDKKNFKPYKMIIYDKEGKEKLKAIYKGFEYNVNIKEQTLFN